MALTICKLLIQNKLRSKKAASITGAAFLWGGVIADFNLTHPRLWRGPLSLGRGGNPPAPQESLWDWRMGVRFLAAEQEITTQGACQGGD